MCNLCINFPGIGPPWTRSRPLEWRKVIITYINHYVYDPLQLLACILTIFVNLCLNHPTRYSSALLFYLEKVFIALHCFFIWRRCLYGFTRTFWSIITDMIFKGYLNFLPGFPSPFIYKIWQAPLEFGFKDVKC